MHCIECKTKLCDSTDLSGGDCENCPSLIPAIVNDTDPHDHGKCHYCDACESCAALKEKHRKELSTFFGDIKSGSVTTYVLSKEGR